MSAADEFRSQFDADGRFRKGNGELPVVFATRGGGRFPGRFHFKGGLCVRAEMELGGDWVLPDNSPLHGVRFLLHFDDNKLSGVMVDQGRIIPLDDVRSPSTKRDFLANFRIARNLFAHPRVIADSPAIDTAAVEQMLARAAIWLTPKSVAGFNAADFPELGVARQQELLSAVLSFRALASEVPADMPATREQYGNATVAFRKMLGILEPYLALPDEARKVETALRTVQFPSWVVNWDYELGSDADGFAAVWVNVFADELAAPKAQLGRAASELTTKIRQAFEATKVERWPYVRLKTAMEHKAG
jgi:hypothetical protein